MKTPDDLPEDHRTFAGRITGWVAGQPPNVILEAITAAVAEERERCAKLAEGFGVFKSGPIAEHIAAAIRARKP